MKKLMTGMILAGLAFTSAVAMADDAGQTNNSAPAMEAQPQTGNAGQANANLNTNVNGNSNTSANTNANVSGNANVGNTAPDGTQQ
ncbi:MAG: hypothetical protein JO131_05675 [Gammaproteobacteria bacterium]|nr:hypothetical protein [Gammaproteobacteria bacterium]